MPSSVLRCSGCGFAARSKRAVNQNNDPAPELALNPDLSAHQLNQAL